MGHPWTTRPLVVAGIAVSLLAGGCAAVAPEASGGTTGPAGSASGTSNPGAVPSGLSLPTTEDATYLAAAEAELALRRQLLADVRAVEVIGPEGAAVLAETERLETAFSERAIVEFVAEMGLDLTAATDAELKVAAAGPVVPPPGLGYNEWSGSLFGATSFMVSTWMGFAPEMLRNAGGNEFVTQTQNRTEPHDSTIEGGLKEQLTLTQRLTVGAGRGRIVFDVVMTSAAVLTRIATGEEVARRTSTGNGHFEVNACPDANGVGEGRYRIINQERVTRPGGLSNGGASTTDATFRVTNGDDARLIQTEVQAAVSSGVHGTTAPADGSPGEPIDWNAQAAFQMVIPASGSARMAGMTGEASTNATDANRGALITQIVMADYYLAEAAKKAEGFWRSGACIDMKTSEESRDVRSGQALTITIDPKHKFDGAPVKAPVSATFTGKENLEPQGSPQDSPATLTFTAGRETGDKGTIELKQVGKRGIGKKTLVFTVGVTDYRIEVVGPLGQMSGQKCNGKEGEWTIGMGAQGASGTITFTIPRGGTSADAHAVYDVVAGGANAHWDVSGPVSFIEGDPATLSFGTLRGTVTVEAVGQSITTRNETVAFVVPLQAGKFCT
jgi:hypothetical protein